MHVACRLWAAHLLRLPLVILLAEVRLAMSGVSSGSAVFAGLRVVLASARDVRDRALFEYLRFERPQLVAALWLGIPGTRGAVTVCRLDFGLIERQIFSEANSMSRRCQRLRERIECIIHGHRDLTPAAAYGEILTGADDKELHYCGACGSAVWVTTPRNQHRPRSWSDTGLAGAREHC